MNSITYYLTLLVIKLKGVKHRFSESPIDYKRLRKEDVHAPKEKSLQPCHTRRFNVAATTITELSPEKPNNFLILFCHGGAFVYGPAQHHWDAAKRLVMQTACSLWLIDYPKAPEHDIGTISSNIDAVYAKALEEFDAGNIILIGDSVGGTLLVALTQRLVQQSIPLPAQLLLLSPVMDASLSNPEISSYDVVDPMLSREGVLSAKMMCAQQYGLVSPMISPLAGSFAHFPKTVLFVAEHDITYPDQKIAAQKMVAAGVEVEVIFGKSMPHIWPILPVMQEGKAAFAEMVERIRKTTTT